MRPRPSFNPPTAPSSGGTRARRREWRSREVSTHPPLLRAVGHSACACSSPRSRCFNPPTAPSSGGTAAMKFDHALPCMFQPTHRSFERWDAAIALVVRHRVHVSTHPPLLRAVGRRISVLCRRSSARFQPTHRSFERWDAGEGDADAWRPPVSTHPPLLRAVGHPGALVGRPQRRCFNPPTAPSSGGTWST